QCQPGGRPAPALAALTTPVSLFLTGKVLRTSQHNYSPDVPRPGLERRRQHLAEPAPATPSAEKCLSLAAAPKQNLNRADCERAKCLFSLASCFRARFFFYSATQAAPRDGAAIVNPAANIGRGLETCVRVWVSFVDPNPIPPSRPPPAGGR